MVRNMSKQNFVETEIQIKSPGLDQEINLKGNIKSLHDDPKKIHQLLDLLDLPKNTEVRVITTAASVIVR
jgi:hypothetical protein